MHVGKRRAVVADWVGEGATTVGRTHRIVDEHPIGREQVDPALQIFPFGNRIGVTNSGHIVILHELLLSQQCGSDSRIAAERGDGRTVGAIFCYGAAAVRTLRSLRRSATRARRLPRLRAVVSSASTGCREPSGPARVPGP